MSRGARGVGFPNECGRRLVIRHRCGDSFICPVPTEWPLCARHSSSMRGMTDKDLAFWFVKWQVSGDGDGKESMDTEGQMETRTHGFQLQVRENATNGSCNHKLSHYFLHEKDGRSTFTSQRCHQGRRIVLGSACLSLLQ